MKNKKILRMLISCVCVIALLSMSLCTVYAAEMTEEETSYYIEIELELLDTQNIEYAELDFEENTNSAMVYANVYYGGQLAVRFNLLVTFYYDGWYVGVYNYPQLSVQSYRPINIPYTEIIMYPTPPELASGAFAEAMVRAFIVLNIDGQEILVNFGAICDRNGYITSFTSHS